MNFVARVRPKAQRAVSLQPDMLESMVERLFCFYRRRFPQVEQPGSLANDEGGARLLTKTIESADK